MGAPFRAYEDRNLLVIRWLEPSPEAMGKLGRKIIEMNSAHGPVLLAAIVGGDCPVFDNATRKALATFFDESESVLEASWTVLLGHTLRQSMFRSIFAGINLLMGRRAQNDTLGSVDAMIDAFTDKGAPVEGLVDSLEQAQVLVPEQD